MSARVQLNNFRFSIYIDADGTVTFTDLPPELHEVMAALDPTRQWATSCATSSLPFSVPPANDLALRRETPENVG